MKGNLKGSDKMENIHIKNFIGKHVHFIGIGGISMSGIAEILLNKGYNVSGSDIRNSAIIERLRTKGANIYIGHRPSNINGANLVVYTAAINEENPELLEAHKNSIPTMDRATLLGQLMETYPFAIGVSGTHGKTTTTSMLSIIMEHADLDPTILVGGEVDEIGGNVRTGTSDYFLTEACEYVESFLKFHPYIALILNIDEDHLDYFKNLDHIYSAFLKYARLVPPDGYVVGCIDDPLVEKLMKEAGRQTVSFGIEKNADLIAHSISFDDKGCPTFIPSYMGKDEEPIHLNVPGKHNIYNALGAYATAKILGVDGKIIKEALSLYHGTHRRFEIKGTVDNITVIDDYAHHPNEIRATLNILNNFSHNRIWCIFQPHTYTRTKKLFNRFIDAFHGVDKLIVTDIYAAREKNPGDIHAKDIVSAINENGQDALYISDFKDIVSYLAENVKSGDIIITMGAGNVYEVGESFLKSFQKVTPKAL